MGKDRLEVFRGTLDMLVLKTLTRGPMHGFGILKRIEGVTDGDLLLEEGTLYPALYRMARKKWIRASWGRSETNRPAKYYELTDEGRRQLAAQEEAWRRFSAATAKILRLGPESA